MSNYKDSNKPILDGEQLSALAQSKPMTALSLFCQSLVVKPSKYKTSFSVK